ncbi:MAG: CotS family spore coat protein [Bacillota bacterium]|nr:CotS family spore coat protein [Bacillota bacterium]
MLDLRYRDKEYLTQYDLNIDLFNLFNIKVDDIIPVRKVYMLCTKDGYKVLKKVDYKEEELQFIIDAMNYIRKSFDRIINFVKTREGTEYTIWNGDIYYIMDLVDGKECEYSNPVDIAVAALGLGELHKSGEGFKTKYSPRNNNGRLINSFNRKLKEMEFFKTMAEFYDNKKEFDAIFLENTDYYMNQVRQSVSSLEQSQYYKLCSEEDKIVLCHHDLAHHNILVNNEQAYFIDFDYSMVDLRVHDLCNFINKVVKNYGYDISKFEIIIENYSKVNKLSKREMDVLLAMLTFPEDIYSIARDYYTKRKTWDEDLFLNRLNKKISNEKYREEFLKDLCDYLKSN